MEKGFRKSKYRDELVPTRPCKKCSTEINGLDYAGDYCGRCSAILREELIDFIRASEMSQEVQIQQTLRIYRVKVWMESLYEELKAELSNWREDPRMSMAKECPYCEKKYEAKYKNSPNCGAEECIKAHKREINRRMRENKKRHKAHAEEPQVENIPSAKTSHSGEGTPEQVAAFQKVAATPPPVEGKPGRVETEAIIKIAGQEVHIPLVIYLDIKVEVNASRD